MEIQVTYYDKWNFVTLQETHELENGLDDTYKLSEYISLDLDGIVLGSFDKIEIKRIR